MERIKSVNKWLGILNIFGALVVYLFCIIYSSHELAVYGLYNLIVGAWLYNGN